MPENPRLRRLAAVTAAIILTAALSSCSSEGAAEKSDNTVRVAIAPTAAFLPAYVAEKEGFFKKRGLDVTITKVQNLDTVIPALGRQFDVGGAGAAAIAQAAARGIDVRLVSGNTVETKGNQQVAVLVPTDSKIQGFADLGQASVGTASLTGLTHIATKVAVMDAGGSVKKMRSVEIGFPNMGDSLKAGNVDAVENVQPFTGALVKAGVVRDIGDPIIAVTHGKSLPFMTWAATGKWAREHAHMLEEWRAALNEAITYIAKHEQDSRDLLTEMTGLPADIVKLLPLPHYDTSITAEQIQTWIDLGKKVGLKTGNTTGKQLLVAP